MSCDTVVTPGRPVRARTKGGVAVTNQVETPDTVAAVRFMSIELPELLGITDTVHAGALDALAAVLADAHVLDDLSPAHAKRVGETVAVEVIRCDWALVDAPGVVTDRAIAAQLDRDADLDDSMAVGLALLGQLEFPNLGSSTGANKGPCRGSDHALEPLLQHSEVCFGQAEGFEPYSATCSQGRQWRDLGNELNIYHAS